MIRFLLERYLIISVPHVQWSILVKCRAGEFGKLLSLEAGGTTASIVSEEQKDIENTLRSSVLLVLVYCFVPKQSCSIFHNSHLHFRTLSQLVNVCDFSNPTPENYLYFPQIECFEL